MKVQFFEKRAWVKQQVTLLYGKRVSDWLFCDRTFFAFTVDRQMSYP